MTMQIGVIAEGKADFAVIRNIIKGVLSTESFEINIISLRPELQADETALHEKNATQFSNWELVKEECTSQEAIRNHLESELEGSRLFVIHIDAAECELPNFGVVRPDRALPSYVEDCYRAIEQKMNSWLVGCDLSLIAKAIAVEETDAWLLALYDAGVLKKTPDTGNITDPKEKLDRAINRPNAFSDKDKKKLFAGNTIERYDTRSKALRKPKELREAMNTNASLRLFVEDLHKKAEALEPGVCR